MALSQFSISEWRINPYISSIVMPFLTFPYVVSDTSNNKILSRSSKSESPSIQ